MFGTPVHCNEAIHCTIDLDDKLTFGVLDVQLFKW